MRAKTDTRIPIAMRENAKALCDVTRKIIQDQINWRNIAILLVDRVRVRRIVRIVVLDQATRAIQIRH